MTGALDEGPFFGLEARPPGRGVHRFSHEAMATVFEIRGTCPDPDVARHAARAAFDVVDRLEQTLSRFIENSDISRINHLAAGEPPAGNITLHGKIANIPASEVEIEVQTTAPYAITLRGVVHERQMYGPKYELTAELTLVPGKPSFNLTDTIRNAGGQPQELCLLYHINQGAPILEPGSRLVASVSEHAPRDDGYPERDIAQYDRYAKPTPGSTEQVYFLELEPDRHGSVTTLLHNKNRDMALALSWPKKQLPNFALWKAQHDQRDGYVTGLEPCTCYPLPRPIERGDGRVIELKPGASYKTQIEFELFNDKQAIAKAAARI